MIQAAETECHSLGGLSSKHSFLPVPQADLWDEGASTAGWNDGSFPSCRYPAFPCIFTRGAGWGVDRIS